MDNIKSYMCPSCGQHAWRTGIIKDMYNASMYYQCCDPDCGAVWEFWDSVDEYYKHKVVNRGACI